MTLANTIKNKIGTIRLPSSGRTEPLWKGPSEDGVTQSLLSRYLTCKERFRIMVIDGLQPAPTFSPAIEFGQMWHACEEELAASGKKFIFQRPDGAVCSPRLQTYVQSLVRRYPTQLPQIQNWYGICKTMFPLYVRFWEQHEDVKGRTPLWQERPFMVRYKLPSGRYVWLRGKWDAVDVIRARKTALKYVQENKTKGNIREVQLVRQLTFDLQTMIYVVALDKWVETATQPLSGEECLPIGGVRYNVIRRPAHHQGKKETPNDFLTRLRGIIEEKPDEFFMRWKVEVAPSDIVKFCKECLDPILENLCDDYDWWSACASKQNKILGADVFDGERRKKAFPEHTPRHYRHPFGVRNILDEGGATDLDEYLSSGSEVGLVQVEELFGELKEEPKK